LYNVKTETDGTRNDQCFMSLEWSMFSP
jgi:hypothetical protein